MVALMADVPEQGGIDDFGERSWAVRSRSGRKCAGGAVVALVRSAMSHTPGAARLREFVQAELLARIAERLDVPDADPRRRAVRPRADRDLLYRDVLPR